MLNKARSGLCYRDLQGMNVLVLMQAYYRGARAALKLGEYSEALQLCQRGMSLDTEAPELQQLSMEADRKLKVCSSGHCWVSRRDTGVSVICLGVGQGGFA